MSERWATWSRALISSPRLLRLVSRLRPHVWTMPCVKAVRRWKIRPMSALRGIRRSRAVVWQRVRGVARACRNGAGYRINYNDPIQEEQEMVCLEVRMVSVDFPCKSLTLVVVYLQWLFSLPLLPQILFLFASQHYYLLLMQCHPFVLTAVIQFGH